MSLKHLTIGALVAVCTLVAPAAGQKNELTGMLGHTFISDLGIPNAASFDQNVHFGKGWTYEINYSRRVFDADLWSLFLEVPFVANRTFFAEILGPAILEGAASGNISSSASFPQRTNPTR